MQLYNTLGHKLRLFLVESAIYDRVRYTKKNERWDDRIARFMLTGTYLLLPSVSDVPAVMRCAYRIGNAVMRTTSMAVTFVIGRLRGLSI